VPDDDVGVDERAQRRAARSARVRRRISSQATFRLAAGT
jgi:hypothetical protein